MNTNDYTELFKAIETIALKVVKENTAQIYSCVVLSTNGNKATVSLNGKTNNVTVYGDAPEVGKEYRLFVPCDNFSNAFIIVS